MGTFLIYCIVLGHTYLICRHISSVNFNDNPDFPKKRAHNDFERHLFKLVRITESCRLCMYHPPLGIKRLNTQMLTTWTFTHNECTFLSNVVSVYCGHSPIQWKVCLFYGPRRHLTSIFLNCVKHRCTPNNRNFDMLFYTSNLKFAGHA